MASRLNSQHVSSSGLSSLAIDGAADRDLGSRDSLARRASEPSPAPLAEELERKRDESLTQRKQEDVPYGLTLVDAMDVLIESHPDAFEFSFDLWPGL